MSALRHILAILTLPFTVVIVIPLIILAQTQISFNLIFVILGILFLALGLTLVIQTISLFITVGKGTLAPWMPTQKLVVRGIYRHVRNPMISGVFCLLLGEACIFGSPSLLTWLFFFWLTNFLYIPRLEEPDLEKRFGGDYVIYKANVPRWIPRLTPWKPPFDPEA